jgi:hypothetical protein
VVVEITTVRDYHHFEKRVREAGFEHDQDSGVICRFKEPRSGLLLDVMQIEELMRHPLFDNGIVGALAGPEAYERLELVVRPRIVEIIASRP